MADDDLQIADAIRATQEELNTAREVVRQLANELADVIDVIEPAIAEHANRLRQARMSSLDEMRQITTHVMELRRVLLAPETERMLRQRASRRPHHAWSPRGSVMGWLERMMDRYRGTNGWLGWLVLRADVRWLKRHGAIDRRETK
jgi:hypothetical protein